MTPKHLLYPLATAIVHRGYEAQWLNHCISFSSNQRLYDFCAVVERKGTAEELRKLREDVLKVGGLPEGTTLSSYLETNKRN